MDVYQDLMTKEPVKRLQYSGNRQSRIEMSELDKEWKKAKEIKSLLTPDPIITRELDLSDIPSQYMKVFRLSH